MSYSQFNRNVYSYYIESLIPGEYNTLTIPKSDFEDLIEDVRYIHTFKEIKEYDWSLLLKFDENIPKYFGLLALQCHAAFMMQNDGHVSSANFRERFIAITGIESTNVLTKLFSENYNNNLNIQEKIWMEAKHFFDNKNIFLNIPIPKSYAGRYTQFPESQCVLNYEDLKEYRNFYNHIYTNYETIDYENFISEFKKYRSRLYGQLKRPNNLSSLKENEEKIKRRQVFDFYNSLEWLNFNIRVSPQKKSPENYIAKIDSNHVVIYDEDFDVFENYNYLLDENHLAIFKQDEVYTTEFNKSNHIEENSFFVIITSSQSINNELLNKNGEKINLRSAPFNFYCVKIEIKDQIPNCLIKHQLREYPIKIIGTKISSKRQYLFSKLPRLVSIDSTPYRLYCNNKRVIENQPNSPGEYQIKVNRYTTYSFEVLSGVKLMDNILESDFKLDLSALEYSLDGSMSGLGIEVVNNAEEDEFSINQWMKILTNNNRKIRKSTSKYILINALSQYKDGQY